MITLLIYFIIFVVLLAVAVYVVRALLPAEYQKFANILLLVVAALFVVWILLSFAHGGLPALTR